MFNPTPTSFRSWLTVVGALVMTLDAEALNPGFNYDETKVPEYVLPDPLVTAARESVQTAAAWQHHRRGEIWALFADHVYGRVPSAKVDVKFEVLETADDALDGTATRKQVRAHFTGNGQHAAMDILIYLPQEAAHPVPLFVGLNFNGNHTVSDDPAILLNENWMRKGANPGVVDHRANASSRGTSNHRWAISTILARGYGVATIYCGDIDPDFDDGFQNGVHPLFYREGQTHPDAHEWGTIAAWAWGLSRAMDYFATDNAIDARKVAVMGHSRLGKAALWAGASDERFAVVISNESGCGGAALARRRFGETVQRINTSFPHWFNDRHQDYNEREDALPVDQHQLIALIAPRPVYIASAEGDQWSDPTGEFLSGKHAEPVYALFGKGGLGVETRPETNQPVGDYIGYHYRTGKHDVTDYDWQQYLNFVDRHFGRK